METEKTMSTFGKTILWLPRIIGIYIVIISLILAFVSFNYGFNLWNIISFLLRVLPSMILLYIAWEIKFTGGMLYIATALIVNLILNRFISDMVLWVSVPLYLSGVLFIASSFFKPKKQEQSNETKPE